MTVKTMENMLRPKNKDEEAPKILTNTEPLERSITGFSFHTRTLDLGSFPMPNSYSEVGMPCPKGDLKVRFPRRKVHIEYHASLHEAC